MTVSPYSPGRVASHGFGEESLGTISPLLLTGSHRVSKAIPSWTLKWLQQHQVRRTGLSYDLGTVFSEEARATLEVAKAQFSSR